MRVMIVGIDCATDRRKVGLSLGEYKDGTVDLLLSELGSTSRKSIAMRLLDWVNKDDLVLIGIDAPLGWPVHLGNELIKHDAGCPLNSSAHSMFRRFTDQFVKTKINKQPLDVGADRIARTAHSALSIVEELRSHLKQAIGLCFEYESIKSKPGIHLLEVYPAATLASYHMKNTGYKERGKIMERERIVGDLSQYIRIEHSDLLIENADVLDSAICLLSVKDFIDGHVYKPTDLSLAKKEGWIWIKKNSSDCD